jgi:hypothetical protein
MEWTDRRGSREEQETTGMGLGWGRRRGRMAGQTAGFRFVSSTESWEMGRCDGLRVAGVLVFVDVFLFVCCEEQAANDTELDEGIREECS